MGALAAHDTTSPGLRAADSQWPQVWNHISPPFLLCFFFCFAKGRCIFRSRLFCVDISTLYFYQLCSRTTTGNKTSLTLAMSVMFGKAKSCPECNLVLLGAMGCGKSGRTFNSSLNNLHFSSWKWLILLEVKSEVCSVCIIIVFAIFNNPVLIIVFDSSNKSNNVQIKAF